MPPLKIRPLVVKLQRTTAVSWGRWVQKKGKGCRGKVVAGRGAGSRGDHAAHAAPRGRTPPSTMRPMLPGWPWWVKPVAALLRRRPRRHLAWISAGWHARSHPRSLSGLQPRANSPRPGQARDRCDRRGCTRAQGRGACFGCSRCAVKRAVADRRAGVAAARMPLPAPAPPQAPKPGAGSRPASAAIGAAPGAAVAAAAAGACGAAADPAFAAALQAAAERKALFKEYVSPHQVRPKHHCMETSACATARL